MPNVQVEDECREHDHHVDHRLKLAFIKVGGEAVVAVPHLNDSTDLLSLSGRRRASYKLVDCVLHDRRDGH